jgi:putative colanic acid biosynthesis UDP-glucose lipid carrier transferase
MFLTLILLILWRFCFQSFLNEMRRRGFNTPNITIFGLYEKVISLAKEVMDNPESGYRLGAYDDKNNTRLTEKNHSYLNGSFAEGIENVKKNKYDVVYIALPILEQKRIQDILFALDDSTATVHVVPDLFMYCLMHGEMSHVGNVQTISVYDNPMKGGIAVVKRLEDLILASAIMTLITIPM